MSDYTQTRDAAGNITSQYGQMLRNLDDDLVERLRSVSANPIYILGKPGTTQGNVIANEAADRIEELESRLAKAEVIVRIIASDKWEERLGEAVDLSCEYLAELMGDDDDE